jgi:photosynthetic reaction center cytochrome c subunit
MLAGDELMKRDDRSLLGFSFAIVGTVVVACVLGAKPVGLRAGTSPDRSRVESAAVPGLGARGAAAQEEQPSAQKTAGEFYMNVQVLKNIPSDQLTPAMRYITAALGVECEYCHDTKNFRSDEKAHKVTARKMMTMMFAIDQDNFNGRREVTCYTCHRGAAHPLNIPSLNDITATSSSAGMMGGQSGTGGEMPMRNESEAGANASSAPAISADAILAKYTDALGGTAAIQKITTLDEKGTASMPARGGMKVQIEELRKAPDKALLTIQLPNGAQMARACNGTIAWESFPGRGAEELTWDDLVRAKQWASFIPGVNMKQEFVREQAVGTEKIGDKDAYRVIAFRKGGGRVLFYFDTQSGLLLRVSERIESPLGSLPQDTDYSDYRDVSGVKLPFSVTVVHVQRPTIYKWDQIQSNVPLEDSRFEKPAQKSAQPQE